MCAPRSALGGRSCLLGAPGEAYHPPLPRGGQGPTRVIVFPGGVGRPCEGYPAKRPLSFPSPPLLVLAPGEGKEGLEKRGRWREQGAGARAVGKGETGPTLASRPVGARGSPGVRLGRQVGPWGC